MGDMTLRKLFWVDGDLKEAETAVEDAIAQREFSPAAAPALDTVVELLRDVAKTEFDRESNLNTRAAAVGAVAGLIVAASSAVGKSVFDQKELVGAEKDVAIGLMVIGLVAVVASMVMVVVVVLRPKQAKTRQTFLTDAIVDVWREPNGSSTILGARKVALSQLVVDRLLRTIALWSVRNRQKSRWLGRAWVFLALGILLIGAAGVLVATAVLNYWIVTTIGMVAGGLLLVWGVLKLLFHTGRKLETEKTKREEQLDAIIPLLTGAPRKTLH